MRPATIVLASVLAACGGESATKESKRDVATVQVRSLAQAHIDWLLKTRDGRSCPTSLPELTEYSTSKSVTDPWGNPLRFICGRYVIPTMAGEEQFGVISNGPDGAADTEDDICSWQ